MSGAESPAAVAAIAALSDPTRRALYRYIAARGVPVGREDAAAAVGVPHHVARFHLDRLHEAGLLEVEYKRPAGRAGPGAGRPAKLYRPGPAEFSVSVPERRYDLAGLVLTQAVATAMASDKPAAQALDEAAGDAGRAIGEAARAQADGTGDEAGSLAAAVQTLDAYGFSPRAEGDGYALGNCPFHALSAQLPEVVCRMNLALIASALDAAGARTASARLDPAEGRCCVTVRLAHGEPGLPA
jgi:predicted ArsR family transcriptional regulator